MASYPPTVGSLFGYTVVTPGDVDANKAALLAQVKAYDAAVQASASKVPAATLAEWNGWAAGVEAFLATPTSFFGAGGENDQVGVDTQQLAAWETQINTYLGAPAPPANAGASSADPTGTATTSPATSSALPYVVGGVVLAGLAALAWKHRTAILAFL